MNHLVENGTFLLNQVNENPGVTLALYYVLPRCLMAMSFVYVSNIVNQVIRKSLKNAMKMEEKAATDEMTGLYNKKYYSSDGLFQSVLSFNLLMYVSEKLSPKSLI